MGRRFIIAAGHPATAEAAAHAMHCGGNAFDGILAGWLASCIAEPVLTSPGGGGFAMVSPASGKTRLYDFFAQTPMTVNPDGHTFPVEADFGSTRQVFHLGAGSIATPGCVAGILQMHGDFGIIPFSECAAPARQLSLDGIRITSQAATLLEVVNDLYQATPQSLALFQSRVSPGKCLAEGEVFHNPDFSRFLDMLESEGARWFYHGDIGKIIGEYCKAHEGHLRRIDFEAYQVHVREPLEINHRGSTVWLNPAPSMGGTLVGLGLLAARRKDTSRYPDLDRQGWLDWIHPIRLMSLLRTPGGFGQLSEQERIHLAGALKRSPQLAASLDALFPGSLGNLHTSGTTQLSIIDHEGNEIAMTTSNGSGSAIIAGGTGFMLNNMLGEEDLQPDGLHTWAPDRRLASMMCPTIVHLANGSRIATGSGGSNRIRSTVLQVLRHMIDGGMAVEDAISAPRLHWEAGELHAESGAAEALQSIPGGTGFPVVFHSVPNLFFGGAHSAGVDANGNLHGQGDFRRGGVALAG